MIFVTDDHRTIRLAQKNKESRGVIPELDESLMRILAADSRESIKPRVRLEVSEEVRTVKKF